MSEDRYEREREREEREERDRATLDDLPVLHERLRTFMRISEEDRRGLHAEIETIRKQTHDWMQAMLNRLPPWAVAVGGFMCSGLGAMLMYIITKK